MRLITRLTVLSISARDCQSESYACELVRISPSRFCDIELSI